MKTDRHIIYLFLFLIFLPFSFAPDSVMAQEGEKTTPDQTQEEKEKKKNQISKPTKKNAIPL